MPVVRQVIATLAAVTGLAACGTSAHTHQAASDGQLVQVSVSACGRGWSASHAGAQHLRLQNTDAAAGTVDVVTPATGAVYAEVDPLGPNTTVDLQVTLGAGHYALRCAMTDEAVVTGPVITLTGATTGAAPGVVPVEQAQLITYTQAYEHSVTTAIPGLAALVDQLRADVDAGNLTAARTDWVPAHQAYERLGAAYDAFGPLNGAINGTAAGLHAGVNDPHFTGFHRVEYSLWHGTPATAVRPWVDRLAADVTALGHQFATAQIDPLQLSIRAHEISENALQFELTGLDDYGSHSELATVAANLVGTTTVLGIIRPLLVTRDHDLPAIDAGLARLHALVAAQHHATGWTPLTALPIPQRDQLNADLGALCEQLATVAAVLEPRVTR